MMIGLHHKKRKRKMNENPVIVITGTRYGIGRYLTEYYIGKGFLVVGCSRGDIDYQFDKYLHFCIDVSDEFSVKKMFAEIRKKYGRLDVRGTTLRS